jgi:hypothetical protein
MQDCLLCCKVKSSSCVTCPNRKCIKILRNCIKILRNPLQKRFGVHDFGDFNSDSPQLGPLMAMLHEVTDPFHATDIDVSCWLSCRHVLCEVCCSVSIVNIHKKATDVCVL